MATSRFADKKRGPAVPQKEPVPDSAIVPELLVKVELGIMTKDVAKELVQKVIDAEKKLFTDEHYKLGPGTLSDKLTGILISDSLRNKINGANLIVRLQVKQEDYLRVRRRLEKGIRRTTSVDSLVTVLLPPKKTDSHPLLNSLDLATTPSTQDSSFTHWVNNPCTKQLVLKMRKTSQALIGVEAKHEISQKELSHKMKEHEAKHEIALHQMGLQEDMVRSLQKEVTRLTQEQETAQKLLLDNKREIQDLTGANKGMGDTIDELLADKTKLTNKLAMKEDEEKLKGDKVESLQREVTRLTQEKETAQKLLLDNKKEIEELTGANKGMKDTIDELLAEKTKLTNKLAMKEDEEKLKEDKVESLQREVTRLTQEKEAAQKLLLDKKEIEDLTGANKGMKDTIDELLADKTKLANKLTMLESKRDVGEPRASGSKQERSPEVVAGSSKMMRELSLREQDVVSVLLVIDAYGSSYGGSESTFNRQVAQFLKRHGATVHSTALQATEEDKRCATEDGVILHLPVQGTWKKKTPSLEWLTYYHSIHYPDIPQDMKCIVGHTDITSDAAKSIQENRCQRAKLILFNHDKPEDTEHYMGTKKAMAMGWKKEGNLEDAKNADAVFSLGRRIYDYFKTKYMSLGESKPRQHFLFLPRPSPVFEAISVRPRRGQKKVVLSVGRVTEMDKLKGHDLVARAMGEVAEEITNIRLLVHGIDEDDWEARNRILENLHSGRIKPILLPCGTQEDIAQDMQQAHLVLMLSRAESFGLVGLEAIAAGIPVLISDKSGLADMIMDLIKEKKCPADMRHRIVRESDLGEDAREWAKRIIDTLEYSELEFDKAAEYKKKLLESKYWDESHQNLLRVCGLTD
ncbi:hypothetical protein Bbelb_261160 [Branchiostoma belcheri]|nr:hypothetical protein Bbelb_261160 [Branchiostoma belcheri]